MRANRQGGFSLVEVVLFVVFGVVIVAAISYFTRLRVITGKWRAGPPVVVSGGQGTFLWMMMEKTGNGPASPLQGRAVNFAVTCGPGVQAVISATNGNLVGAATATGLTDANGIASVTIKADGDGECYVTAEDPPTAGIEHWSFKVLPEP